MIFTERKEHITIVLIVLIAIGLSFANSYPPRGSAQMMGPGMGMGMMQHGMMGPGTIGPGMGMMFPNIVPTNTTYTRSLHSIVVTIVSDAQNMGDKAFQPNPINIKTGNTVTWVNNDTVMHTITSGIGPNDPNAGRQFDSGFLSPGQTFNHTFQTAGQFNYFCEPHPDMVGVVSVK